MPDQPGIQSVFNMPPPAAPSPPPLDLRRFGDIPDTRRRIFENTLTAAQAIQPVSNTRFSLSLENPAYSGQESFSPEEQKRAVLENRTLSRRLQGEWVWKDSLGAELGRKKATIANVPYLTDMGAFIYNGSKYLLSHQMRLRAGVFARRKENNEIEAHVNTAKGFAHRVAMDPESGVFKIHIGQASIPLTPLLHAMGTTTDEMRDAWGPELTAINMAKNDPRSIDKLYAKVVGDRGEPGADSLAKAAAVVKAFHDMTLDPEVTKRTLGEPFANISPKVYLATTKKLIGINKREEQSDDRDSPTYQRVMGPEDMFPEKMKLAPSLMRRLLWKSANRGDISHIKTGAFDDLLHGVILHSGLANSAEEINPSELFDHQNRVTRMGAGGIPSRDSIPDESRSVQPTHLGFIDPIRTPESESAGVDLRFSRAARKGPDGRIYTQVRNMRTGQLEYKSPQDLAEHSLGFPGANPDPTMPVGAIRGGRFRVLPANKIDYQIPDMESAFSPLANMIPGKSAVKGQRAVMASRMLSQALPLREPEAPLVQSGMPNDPNRSFEEEYAQHMGAVRAAHGGRVTSIDGQVSVLGQDGKQTDVPLYSNFPYNRKTLYHQTPAVKVGDVVQPGQLLATSNYTNQQGTTALGKNMRVAYIPFRGLNYEDANVISESAAQRLTSEHAYQHGYEWDDRTKKGKKAFVSIHPGVYDRDTLDNFTDDGIIKPGTPVKYGDPLILATREREPNQKSLLGGRPSFSDESVTWEHHSPGEVTDVAMTHKGANVVVKAYAPSQVGDKLCYDPETEILTTTGWRPVAEISEADCVASLTAAGQIEYLNPAAVHRYLHAGPMYKLETTQVDLCVTDNHHLYAQVRHNNQYHDEYKLVEARTLFGRRFRLKRDGEWSGRDPDHVVLPAIEVAVGYAGRGRRIMPTMHVPIKTYAMLLGMFLSEGNIVDQSDSGSYGFDICQIKEPGRQQMLAALTEAGVAYSEHGRGTKVRIYGLQWLRHLAPLGHAADKYIPPEVFGWSKDTLSELYKWLMWGDGSVGGTSPVYHTTSRRLADDVQRLVLHLGMSANIDVHPPKRGMIKGKEYDFRARYWVSIFQHKQRPEINHGHCRQQGGQREEWLDYNGFVFCVTLPRNHVLYVRRNGKPVWCGNSGRFGDKGIISSIIPDDQMPHDAQGRPFELLANPLGIISRTNPAQIVEAALGKIAEKRGTPYKLQDFQEGGDMAEYAWKELQKHGVPDTEDVFDPSTGRKIPDVFTGNRWFMKLHHSAESGEQGRGVGEGYTSEGLPSKGGVSGSKRHGMLELSSMLSHGATSVIRDANLVRGQAQPQYWAQYMAGYNPPTPQIPFTHQKFVHQLKASGINVVKEGPRSHIMALTNKDIDQLAGDREIQNAETVNWKDMKPVPGGLFAQELTGGHRGNAWSSIRLHEPLPSPVMEDPIRKVLGLTEPKFRNILAGKDGINGQTGAKGIADALSALNLDREIAHARADIASGKTTKRDAAIRKLGYLRDAQRLGIHPKDWMLDRVPVIPPVFRPVSVMGGNKKLPLVDDANYLYKEVFDANKNLKELSSQVDDVGEERLTLYDAFKGVTGMGDPVHPKNQESQVKGILRHVFGTSPKSSVIHRKLLGSQVDRVGRAVIAPDPNLDMDSVGLPEDSAWSIYHPDVVRRLVRNGMEGRAALRAAEARSPDARAALQTELENGVVIYNRAPTLHRYGIMAARPRLTKNRVLTVSPLVIGGFQGDFDGDKMNFHVPQTTEARQEALDKMLPSRNLFSVADLNKAHYLPSQEYVGGLYEASARIEKDKPALVFADKKAAIQAYHAGEIGVGRRVEIINH